jgi:nucleotide-binding universal stress UspA family protein
VYDSILTPTDGSKDAWRGTDRALELAAESGAAVHALFVVDECVYGVTPALSSHDLYFEAVEREAREFSSRW